LQPKLSPAYFGITDTIYVHSKFGGIAFNKNKDIDIISIKLNSNNIIDQVDSKKVRDNEDFILDTGLNHLIFFADDFGNNGFSSASVNVQLDGNMNNNIFDFKQIKNLGATFIVLKIFMLFDEKSATSFSEKPIEQKVNNTSTETITVNNIQGNNLNRPVKIIGNIVSKSKQLTFAIWDDAVEDGDTISLSINNRWITQGFPVKKKPQFITVTLDPGPNEITFIADNLGSIIPNTSVLEIIDGNKRKTFYIETDFNHSDAVKIFYDVAD
jgi:hypothetical protein